MSANRAVTQGGNRGKAETCGNCEDRENEGKPQTNLQQKKTGKQKERQQKFLKQSEVKERK